MLSPVDQDEAEDGRRYMTCMSDLKDRLGDKGEAGVEPEAASWLTMV